ncbi:MAG: hypothetical protein M5U18_02500 [Dehalococcoidia bacterium]|nr:hypothetical protein [Dehalococcoidia bacterium]
MPVSYPTLTEACEAAVASMRKRTRQELLVEWLEDNTATVQTGSRVAFVGHRFVARQPGADMELVYDPPGRYRYYFA